MRAAVRDARAAGSAVDARASEIQSSAASARALLGAGAALPGGLQLVARAAGALSAVAAALEPTAAAALQALSVERATFTGVEQELAAAHRQVEAAEGGAREARERLHATAVELRLAQERVAEAGPVTGDLPDEPLDPVAVAGELADLERRRLNIGAVNELAAQERTELAERELHLTEQIDDLQKSSESLAAHLGELDNAVDEGFEAIFNAVSERFAEVVGWLFPGGTGRLRLVEPEDEDGEQGVVVEVVPANKRARPMSLMSGGERSLIAMGFMLSLAMARPAPFYLLDEVEAALDDANLRRFLGVLRRLAGETQFIVITHQQPTELQSSIYCFTVWVMPYLHLGIIIFQIRTIGISTQITPLAYNCIAYIAVMPLIGIAQEYSITHLTSYFTIRAYSRISIYFSTHLHCRMVAKSKCSFYDTAFHKFRF